MTPEVAVSIPFTGALPAGDESHRGIDQKSVAQCFQFQFSGLFRMQIFRLDSISPQSSQGCRQSSQSDIGAVLIELMVSAGQVPIRVSVARKAPVPARTTASHLRLEILKGAA